MSDGRRVLVRHRPLAARRLEDGLPQYVSSCRGLHDDLAAVVDAQLAGEAVGCEDDAMPERPWGRTFHPPSFRPAHLVTAFCRATAHRAHHLGAAFPARLLKSASSAEPSAKPENLLTAVVRITGVTEIHCGFCPSEADGGIGSPRWSGAARRAAGRF